MDFEFDCTHCGQPLSAESADAGRLVECPSCGDEVAVPTTQPAPSRAPLPDDITYCPKCGQENLENNYKCIGCGFVLHGKPQQQYVVSDDGTMGGLIPYKNSQALWAYYLSIFSLIPCVGIPTGIVALVLGIKGLKYADLHPEARGKGHAWTGIILGGLCAVGYTLLLIATFFAGVSV